MYLDSVLAMTRPPLSFSALVDQRIRWNLGYFETFEKERDYYFKQIGKFNRFGIVTLIDMLVVVFILCLPALLLFIGLTTDTKELMLFTLFIYFLYIVWGARVLFDPGEQAGKSYSAISGLCSYFRYSKLR
jgi:cellulose synthase/poly-beta-1,6-N-acetylglucosamine synthase-like glycosyltransferase